MNKISDRLKCLADHVLPGYTMADIGTDHGFLPIHLLAENVIPFAVMTDINKGPLSKAKNNLDDTGIRSYLYSLRLGPGLAPLKKGEAATIVIAGMGGELISQILTDDKEKALSASTLIFQPRTRSRYLRYTLAQLGIEIVSEDLVEENGKVWEIICAQPRSGKISDLGDKSPYSVDFELPDTILNSGSPLLKAYLEQEKHKFDVILSGLHKTDSVHKEKEEFCRLMISFIKERLKNYE